MRRALWFCCLAPFGASPLRAQSVWRVDVASGTAWNLPTQLVVSQQLQPDIRLRARYATKALHPPPYLLLRIERGTEHGSWGVELLHHKIYLRNRPPEIQAFAISHGLNLLTATRTWTERAGLGVRVGAGLVIAHPESTIRGMTYPENRGILGSGRFIAGPAAQLGLIARRPLLPHLGVFVESKATAAHARVNVSGGHASLWNVAWHVNLGLSLEAGPTVRAAQLSGG